MHRCAASIRAVLPRASAPCVCIPIHSVHAGCTRISLLLTAGTSHQASIPAWAHQGVAMGARATSGAGAGAGPKSESNGPAHKVKCQAELVVLCRHVMVYRNTIDTLQWAAAPGHSYVSRRPLGAWHRYSPEARDSGALHVAGM